MGKVVCEVCSKKCSGNVLRVGKSYFHIDCFKCHECKLSLSQGGFFTHTSDKGTTYHCTKCYHQSFGTKCAACNLFVEGEVVTALGNTYHQDCFRCNRCNQQFSTGEKVTWTGKECLCSKCIQIPIVSSQSVDGSTPVCNFCHGEILDGQALIALDKHWHIWCFKCETCGTILHGEYLNKDGKVYCEKDYQCHHCQRYITGKVLQAGDNHFHPTCARCTKCGDVFSDGEEMYIQGTAIWHPRCGPGPGQKIDIEEQFGNQYYRAESPSMSSTLSRSISPFAFESLPRQTSRSSPYLEKELPINDLSRFYTYSYLTAEPTQGYLRKPLEPRPPKSPQFHRPPDYHYRRRTPTKFSRHGMQAMVDHLQTTTPRPKSPSMNNEEPIELSHYPNAKKPSPSDVPIIERDDFPAPPFPYTDPTRRKFYSSKDDLEEVEENNNENDVSDPQLKREEQELSKIATGIGRVFLKTVKEREKVMAYRKINLDPRKSSRTPSAKVEMASKLRYDNPTHASPSRDMDRPKPWEEEEYEHSFYRSSHPTMTRSQPYINYNMVSSLRHIPKPGYGHGLRNITNNGAESPYTEKYLEKTQSIEFSSGKSDISITSDQPDKSLGPYMNHSASGTFRTTPFSEGFTGYRYASYSPHLRRSMPNVNLHQHSNEPPRQYPYHLLITNNYRLPPDVDRCHLERHLQNSEFEYIFGCSRMDFYRLPEWRRNELKRRAKLF